MDQPADHAGPEEIAHAVAVLRRGGLVAFPTETVYGLGAPSFDQDAVEKVFALKGRPSHNPLIVHVSGPDMARTVTATWPAEAQRLAGAFWPGPLSIVLPRNTRLPEIVTAGSPNVAVRCPDHLVTLALLEALGAPLVGPSANPSGRVSPTCAQHVRESFPESEVYVLDGGPCRAGIESTVLTLATDPPRVLRPGVIGADELSRVLGTSVAVGPPGDSLQTRPESPGMLPVHYAPRSTTVLADRDDIDRLLARADGPAVVLAHDFRGLPLPHRLIPMPQAAHDYAAALYAALREADASDPALIVVQRPPAGGPSGAIWDAVADRLARACAAHQ